MDFFFYITIIVGFSLIYYGYGKKIDNDLKKKELEIEEKKIELEIKRLDHKDGEKEKEEQ
ncbi:hypothetical protein [Halobacillus halophilus]|uniref:hypothetical protein n=1 Tax=Halobacillus halophilus TaxID=1570 RepID=UPI001CD21067|nr:hypothetical protein [Halobacillus halophilus]MCA1010547.1 hypothetical protein [Halobacillus halophilus]